MESPVHKEYNGESPISVNSRIRVYNLLIVFQPQYKYSINVCKLTVYTAYYLALYLPN